MAKWLLLDGYNLAFRSFYAIPDLTRSDGFPTNALHTWVRTLWWLEDNQTPDHMVAFYDSGAARREQLLPAYKSQRDEAPEAFSKQVPVLKALAVAMGYGQIEQEGMEADDLIGHCAVKLVEEGHTVTIVSADKDLAQNVCPNLFQLLPPPTANPKMGWKLLDEAGVEKKFGVSPSQIPEYLALTGDQSDNIPGLPGVGPKTAVKWLKQYHSLEGILANSGRLKPPRLQNTVHQNANQLRLSLALTELESLPTLPSLDCADLDVEALLALLKEYEMHQTRDRAEKRYSTQLVSKK